MSNGFRETKFDNRLGIFIYFILGIYSYVVLFIFFIGLGGYGGREFCFLYSCSFIVYSKYLEVYCLLLVLD